MKIKNFFLILGIYSITVLPATSLVLGTFILLVTSCEDSTSKRLTEEKEYGILWMSGASEGEQGVWETSEEYFLGQFVYDTYTEARFRVITLPAGSKVRARKAGTDRLEIITLNAPASAGDTVVASRGVYYVPK